MMSDNVVNLTSDSESDTSSASRMGTPHDCHLPLIDHDPIELEVIPLSDDLDS